MNKEEIKRSLLSEFIKIFPNSRVELKEVNYLFEDECLLFINGKSSNIIFDLDERAIEFIRNNRKYIKQRVESEKE